MSTTADLQVPETHTAVLGTTRCQPTTLHPWTKLRHIMQRRYFIKVIKYVSK